MKKYLHISLILCIFINLSIFFCVNPLLAQSKINKHKIGNSITREEIQRAIRNQKGNVEIIKNSKDCMEAYIDCEYAGQSIYLGAVEDPLHIYNNVGWMHINLEVYSEDLDIFLHRDQDLNGTFTICAASDNDIAAEDEHLDWNTGPYIDYYLEIQWDPGDKGTKNGTGYVVWSWPVDPNSWFAAWPKSKEMYMQYEDRMTWPFGPLNYNGNYHFHYGMDICQGDWDEERRVYAVYSGYCLEYGEQYDNNDNYVGHKVKIDQRDTDLFSYDNTYGIGYLHLEDIPIQHDSLDQKWVEVEQYLSDIALNLPTMDPHLHLGRFTTANFFWNECGHPLYFYGQNWQYGQSAEYEIQESEYNDATHEVSFYSYAESDYSVSGSHSVCDLNRIQFTAKTNDSQTIINVDFNEFENCPDDDSGGHYYNLRDIYNDQTDWDLFIDISEEDYYWNTYHKLKWIFQYTGSKSDEFSSFTIELFNMKEESQDTEEILRTGTITGNVTLIGGNSNVQDVNITADGITVHPNSSGNYEMDICFGTYDVIASLGGYTSQTIEDVEVILDQITSNIDFTLESSNDIPSGDVTGTWAGNYYIEGDITVPEGETLVINPGTKIKFKGPYIFDIQGTLISEGETNNIITYTVLPGNEDVGWKGLSFNQTPSSNNSILKNCIIKHGIATPNSKDDRYPPDPLCNGGGIFVKDYDNLVIENCIIENNHANHGGGGVYLYNSDILIKDCIIRDNTAWSNPEWPNTKGGGGIYCENSNPQLLNCTIENNLCSPGAGICLYNSSPTIKYCLIINNGNSNTGAALFLRGSNPSILSCTIYGNYGYLGSIFCTANSDPTFRNCIFWDHYYKVYLNDTSSDPHFYYCDIESGLDAFGGYSYSGNFENNIDEDPLLVQEGNHIYHLLERSPCIDAGDPNSQYNDPDDTRADMGCYPTVYDVKKIEDSWNWVSFPRLDREGNDPMYAPDVLQNIEPFPTYLELQGNYLGDDVSLEYNEEWDFSGGLSQVMSTSGYKLETSNEDNSYLPLYGSRVAPDTPITLYASDYYVRWNWIGYWLPQPQMSDVAFGDEWNNVWSIKAEDYYYHDGSMEYKDGISVTYPYSPIPLEYGKGYLVRVHDTVTDFQWNIPNERIPNLEKLESQYFSYRDKPDYEAINIVDIDENILEIGVFQNDVCVGAAVVDSGSAQILAYTEYVSKNESELTFQVVIGRGDKRQVSSYYVYDFATAEYIERKLIAGKQEYSIIRLSTEEEISSPTSVSLSQNVPNPFNHNTTISYAIPKEALVEISIYNIRGQRVRKLVNEKLPAGKYSSVWNGENENGKYLSNGIYFYKLSTGKKEIIKKLVYMR